MIALKQNNRKKGADRMEKDEIKAVVSATECTGAVPAVPLCDINGTLVLTKQ